MNCGMKTAMTFVICLESHECPYLIPHFVNAFFNFYIAILIFSKNIKGVHAEGLYFLNFHHLVTFYAKESQIVRMDIHLKGSNLSKQ
jgi:hypothetical protein